MTICFILQRRFASIGYAIAKSLNKKYGVKKFCGYAFTRRSYNFIKNQSSPAFTNLILDEDIHRRYKTEIIDLSFIKQL